MYYSWIITNVAAKMANTIFHLPKKHEQISCVRYILPLVVLHLTQTHPQIPTSDGLAGDRKHCRKNAKSAEQCCNEWKREGDLHLCIQVLCGCKKEKR